MQNLSNKWATQHNVKFMFLNIKNKSRNNSFLFEKKY